MFLLSDSGVFSFSNVNVLVQVCVIYVRLQCDLSDAHGSAALLQGSLPVVLDKIVW